MSDTTATPARGSVGRKLVLRHDHVALRVVDYDATVAWYVDKLDFQVEQEWPFGEMRLAYLRNGTAKIEVLGGSQAEARARVSDLAGSFGEEGLHHFCLAVDDVDAMIDELARRGVPMLGEAFEVEEIGRRLAFLEDNSGNLIELSAPR